MNDTVQSALFEILLHISQYELTVFLTNRCADNVLDSMLHRNGDYLPSQRYMFRQY